jgi:hypothetical protein
MKRFLPNFMYKLRNFLSGIEDKENFSNFAVVKFDLRGKAKYCVKVKVASF